MVLVGLKIEGFCNRIRRLNKIVKLRNIKFHIKNIETGSEGQKHEEKFQSSAVGKISLIPCESSGIIS